MNCINCNNISLNTRNTYFATQLLRLFDNNNKNKSQHSFDLRLGVFRIFQCEKSKQDFPVRSEVSIDKINVNYVASIDTCFTPASRFYYIFATVTACLLLLLHVFQGQFQGSTPDPQLLNPMGSIFDTQLLQFATVDTCFIKVTYEGQLPTLGY